MQHDIFERTRRRAQVARYVLGFVGNGVQVRLRRGLRGPRRPKWTPMYETLVATLRSGVADIRKLDFPRIRAQEVGPLFPSGAIKQALIEEVAIGSMLADWVQPRGVQPKRHVLYLHGGGYCVGSRLTHRDLLARIALKAQARVLAPDYRLAPEHPLPRAIDDAVTAYRFLLDSGADPARTIIGGDSAGGGLTLATLVALRDAKMPLPAAAVLLSPWLDLTATHASIAQNASFDWIDEGFLRRCARDYVGRGEASDPRGSPLHADLAGLPPILLQVGSAELLLDEAKQFADRASAAGVDVTLEIWEDMVHVWQLFAGLVPEGREAIRAIARFVEQRTP